MPRAVESATAWAAARSPTSTTSPSSWCRNPARSWLVCWQVSSTIAAPSLTDYDQRRTNTKPALYEAADLWTIIFNHADPLTGNLQIRQAIQAAIDMEKARSGTDSGRSEFFHVDPSFYFPPTPWYSDIGAEVYNVKDIERAKELLEEAGYDGEERC